MYLRETKTSQTSYHQTKAHTFNSGLFIAVLILKQDRPMANNFMALLLKTC